LYPKAKRKIVRVALFQITSGSAVGMWGRLLGEHRQRDDEDDAPPDEANDAPDETAEETATTTSVEPERRRSTSKTVVGAEHPHRTVLEAFNSRIKATFSAQGRSPFVLIGSAHMSSCSDCSKMFRMF
jgi:hypothetical protein